MQPRERVLAVLRGEPVDKVPLAVYEIMIPQCAAERRLRNEGLCIINRRYPVFKIVTPNCVTESHTYEEGGRTRTRRVTRTPVGEVYSIQEAADITNWTISHLFKKPEDYRTLLCMVRDGTCVADYAAYALAEKWNGDDALLRPQGVGGPPLHKIMIEWMGVETFATEWAERRDEVLTLERAMCEKLRQRFPIVADAPITHANFGGNEVPEVMGPPRYREFCLPLLDEFAEVLHKKGKLIGSHLDGNNKAWAADVAASKMDYVEAFTPSPGTDMTLAEALRAWPDKVLWINFPSSVHLSSIETIRQTTRELIEAAAGTNRLIIGITEDIPQDRWQQNLLAISEVINEYKK